MSDWPFPQRAPARYWIGGSNAAGILGVSPYRTRLAEYQAIVGEADEDTPDRLSFFRRRKAFEPVAVEIFEEQTGIKIAATNRRVPDPRNPFIRAELDAETVTEANVEIKTVHPLAARDWGRDGTGDDVPTYVVAQAMHGLAVTDRELCYVLAMIGFDDARVYRIERDDETIAAMRERQVAFWRDHVEPRLPPPPSDASDVRRLFPRDSGAAIEATSDLLATILRARELKATIKEAEDELEHQKEAIELAMGPAAVVTFEGKPLVTWKGHDRRSFDQTAFAAAHPDLAEAFQRVTAVRTLRFK